MRATSWPVRDAPTDAGFNLPKPLTASVCGSVILLAEGMGSVLHAKPERQLRLIQVLPAVGDAAAYLNSASG
jgi:hypothetical protein